MDQAKYKRIILSSTGLLFYLMGSMISVKAEMPVDDMPLEIGNQPDSSNEIGGLVLDRTITLMGKNFFNYFSRYWHHNYASSEAVFTIYERPSARWGSQIWIDYRGKQLFKQFVGPRQTNDPELPEKIAKQTYTKITQLKLAEKFLDTFDMEHSEI